MHSALRGSRPLWYSEILLASLRTCGKYRLRLALSRSSLANAAASSFREGSFQRAFDETMEYEGASKIVYFSGKATPPSGTEISADSIYFIHSAYLPKPSPHLVWMGPGGAFSMRSIVCCPSPVAICSNASSVAASVPASPFTSFER